MGMQPRIVRLYDFKKDLDISFIGQPHSNRLEIVARIMQSGLPVEVFGYGWKDRPRLPFIKWSGCFQGARSISICRMPLT